MKEQNKKQEERKYARDAHSKKRNRATMYKIISDEKYEKYVHNTEKCYKKLQLKDCINKIK